MVHPVKKEEVNVNEDPQVVIGDSRAILTGNIPVDNTAPEVPPTEVTADNQDPVGQLNNNTDGDGSSNYAPFFNRIRTNDDNRLAPPETPASQDWRLKISLLPDSSAFYKSGNPGVMKPLSNTDGVIFPYTPSIQMTYYADYQSVTPTHSNFPSRFYASSEVRDVQINGTFTAQSVSEANYVMAAIHFFRSCTKMFYGQDGNKGMPPPLLQVTGLGPHQFNGHKCVLQQFNYTLPENVDYVRTADIYGSASSTDVNQRRAKLDSQGDQYGIFGIAGRIGRLLGIGANPGALRPSINQRGSADLARDTSSYVPTKMEFSLTLLPVVSRKEQTSRYSTEEYANGSGLRKGHW